MSDPILLEIVTPERQVFSGKVAEVQFPTATCGYYGILPGHTPLVTPVGDGLVTCIQGGKKVRLVVFGSFAEVGSDRVTILAREGEAAETIDLEQVRRDRVEAQRLLDGARAPEEADRARTQLQACEIRIQAAEMRD